MAGDATPLIEALLEVIDVARLYLPGEIGKRLRAERARHACQNEARDQNGSQHGHRSSASCTLASSTSASVSCRL